MNKLTMEDIENNNRLIVHMAKDEVRMNQVAPLQAFAESIWEGYDYYLLLKEKPVEDAIMQTVDFLTETVIMPLTEMKR